MFTFIKKLFRKESSFVKFALCDQVLNGSPVSGILFVSDETLTWKSNERDKISKDLVIPIKSITSVSSNENKLIVIVGKDQLQFSLTDAKEYEKIIKAFF